MNHTPFIIAVILVLSVTSTFGLGIGPGTSTIEYTGAESRQILFNIFREQQEPYDVELSVEGVLGPFVKLQRERVTLTQDIVPIQVVINLPEGLPPGPNEARIYVQQVSQKIYSGDAVGIASVRIPHKIVANVPYPDKYLLAEVRVDEQDKDLAFVTVVKNTGSIPLKEVQSSYEIYEQDQMITTLVSQSTSLDVRGIGSIDAQVDKTKLPKGSYDLQTTIHFDGNYLEMQKNFRVGTPTILITYHDKYFAENTVNRMGFEIFNDWNAPLSDISLEIEIFDSNKQTIGKLKTFTFPLSAHENKAVETFWNTKGLKQGTYPAVITTLIGKEKTTQESTLFITTKEEAETKNIKEKSPSSAMDILIVAALALISLTLLGVIILLFILMRKGFGQKPQQ